MVICRLVRLEESRSLSVTFIVKVVSEKVFHLARIKVPSLHLDRISIMGIRFKRIRKYGKCCLLWTTNPKADWLWRNDTTAAYLNYYRWAVFHRILYSRGTVVTCGELVCTCRYRGFWQICPNVKARKFSLIIVTYRIIFAVVDVLDHEWSKDFWFHKMWV